MVCSSHWVQSITEHVGNTNSIDWRWESSLPKALSHTLFCCEYSFVFWWWEYWNEVIRSVFLLSSWIYFCLHIEDTWTCYPYVSCAVSCIYKVESKCKHLWNSLAVTRFCVLEISYGEKLLTDIVLTTNNLIAFPYW